MEFTGFEVGTSVTRESCRAQALAKRAHHVREIWVLLAALALGTGILYAIRSPEAPWLAGVTAAAAIYACLAVQMTAARLYASRNIAVNSILISFGEADFRVITSVEETRFEYGRVTCLEEISGHWILSLRHHTPLVFRKDEVLGGRAEALRAHLEGKTGCAFRSIRR